MGGQKWIYLAGNNGIERMKIGESTSEPFFEAYLKENSRLVVLDMVEAPDESLYAVMFENEGGGLIGNTEIWHISPEGQKINVIKNEEVKINRLAVDERGNLYARPMFKQDSTLVFVYDQEGKLLTQIDSEYRFHIVNGMCEGKDGKVYMLYSSKKRKHDTGILRIDLESKKAVEVADQILPNEGAAYEVIGRGSTSDFIIWNEEGIFNYNLGNKESKQMMKIHEAPCNWSGAVETVLADGRLLFITSNDWVVVEKNGVKEDLRDPNKTYFYYVPIA